MQPAATVSTLVTVIATDSDGSTLELQAPVGTVLMELLRDSGLDVEAVCGGCCACATCHVYVDNQRVGGRGEMEAALVGAAVGFSANRSRLSCQITLAAEHNHLAVVVAPPE